MGHRRRRSSSSSSSSSLNIVGIQEAARLNVVLAVVDFATQVLLVVLGFVLVFSPAILLANIHWGVAPTWSHSSSRSRSRCSPTRGSRPSRTWPRRRATPSARPELDQARRGRRLRDLLHAAAGRALGDAGDAGRTASTDAARRAAADRGSRTTRCSASSRTSACTGRAQRGEDLRRHPRRDDPLHRHERRRDRRVADHLLDGELPAAPRGLPAAAPALQDAVALDPRSSPGSCRRS